MDKTYLRVSLTPDCNFSCMYCSPEGKKLNNIKPLYSPEFLVTLKNIFAQLGVPLYKVRFTGGEPLLLKELPEFAKVLSNENIELTLTTNGSLLSKRLSELKTSGISRINVSIDTLNADRFKTITGSNLKPVVQGITDAIEHGFKIKLNAVLLQQTASDLVDLVEFAKNLQVEIRFIEIMPLGPARSIWNKEYLSGKEALTMLSSILGIPERLESSSTAVRYRFKNGAIIGFIESVSQPFCDRCDRLRLDHRGVLYHCLRVNKGVPLLELFNNYNMLQSSIKKVLRLKKIFPTNWDNLSLRHIGG